MGVTLLELTEDVPEGWDLVYEPDITREEFLNRLFCCMDMVYDRDYFTDPIVHYLVTSMLQFLPEHRMTASFALGLLGDDEDCEMPMQEAAYKVPERRRTL
jgi:hypothetical protein